MGRPQTKITAGWPVSPTGEFVVLDGETHYRIAAYHRMDPFLVSLASDSDLWMFVASGGGLTAGRVDAEGALFPYRTVDQLHDAHRCTGPVTLVRTGEAGEAGSVWQPFGTFEPADDAIERNLYKNTSGTRLVFEEVHHGLGLAFRYAWEGCDAFGWVRTATLRNLRAETATLDLLDGLRDVIPAGAPLALHQTASNLVDAYKRSEIDPATGLGLFSLTAGITDRAEALEVLRANTVWCCGLEGHRIHLAAQAVESFRHGRVVPAGAVLNGARGNFLVTATVEIAPGEAARWHLVADAGRDHLRIAALRRRLADPDGLAREIEAELRGARGALRRIVGSADGLQRTGRDESWAHHFSNVLFNCMRGGVFDRNDDVPVADLIDFLGVRDRTVLARMRGRLERLPSRVPVHDLRALARATGDPDFQRLCHEYLPLYFGRRHGDPSRPWNRFEIRVRDRNGGRALNHEGNWRDIFQNWEALCASFPGFLPNVVARFVNASTVDGHNPYRIRRDGVDWEVVNHDDPWSNIGYWGDHQVIYLLKLLEALEDHDPGSLGAMLGADIFSYADVPYRLRPFGDLVEDARDTIVFDEERAAEVDARVAARGTDGKLVAGPDGEIVHANLFEKLLVPALAKLSNLVPDAGIWMNTQRPEWNDANNALAAGGVSVVTLCYLRRYLAFLADLLEGRQGRNLPVHREVADWFDAVEEALGAFLPHMGDARFDPRTRRAMMGALGTAFSDYRAAVYEAGFSGRTRLPLARAAALCRLAVAFLDRDIAANRRPDGLYHTYNLLDIAEDRKTVEVRPLPEMLEGQVAVLSAGVLSPAEALAVLEALFASDLYRDDQLSFMLQPEHPLPGFLEKNVVPEDGARAVPLLADLLAEGNPAVLARDAEGILRFAGDFANVDALAGVLDALAADPGRAGAVARDRAAVLDLYERVFQHDSYTGRSGVMVAFEGLGCIYWHMVAKLLLAVQENHRRAVDQGAPADVVDGLAAMYHRVRAGIGYEKTVADYGAFPVDPYSHTPAGGGAKQPGMTGQVKEEILTRWGELGVRVHEGRVRFRPTLLDAEEFLKAPGELRYFDVTGEERTAALAAGALAFTYCQVPVVYERTAGPPWIRVSFTDGTTADVAGDELGSELTADLHNRSGWIDAVRVGIPEGALA